MSARAFAYAGVVVGLAVSISANVVETGHHQRSLFALGLAGFWPLALWLALEVLARKDWTGRGRTAAMGTTALVALVAAVLSYVHLHDLLAGYGEDTIPALIGPLGIDGLMATSAAALLTKTTVSEGAAGALGDGAKDVGPEPTSPALGTDPPGRVAAAREVRSEVTEPAEPRQPATLRSDADLLDEARDAIEAGRLTPAPSGNQLRTVLGIGAKRAERLLEQLVES